MNNKCIIKVLALTSTGTIYVSVIKDMHSLTTLRVIAYTNLVPVVFVFPRFINYVKHFDISLHVFCMCLSKVRDIGTKYCVSFLNTLSISI